MTLSPDARNLVVHELRVVAAGQQYLSSATRAEIAARVRRFMAAAVVAPLVPTGQPHGAQQPVLVKRPGIAPRPLDPFFFKLHE